MEFWVPTYKWQLVNELERRKVAKRGWLKNQKKEKLYAIYFKLRREERYGCGR